MQIKEKGNSYSPPSHSTLTEKREKYYKNFLIYSTHDKISFNIV
jgi:hypothetical protein